ncbi:MAG: DoxX family membrane protein [Armatimonadota bacterium]|nr:DoxX family membrane protein [Armatimonadota bacterium]
MDRVRAGVDAVDRALTSWMARYGIVALRLSLGTVFLWFGLLKFFPGLSPAQELAGKTIHTLTFGLVPPHLAVPILAVWESWIGVGLLLGVWLRTTLLLLWLQMLGTITPLVLFPGETFVRLPYAPTLEGQYILKNLVLIAAGLVIGATVRGGRLSASTRADDTRRPWVGLLPTP